jgi:hypothetical protein
MVIKEVIASILKSWSATLKALFSESSEISSMRFMSITSLFIGGYLAIHGVDLKVDLSSLAILCSIFVGAAFTGKVAQKMVEKPAETKLEPKLEVKKP